MFSHRQDDILFLCWVQEIVDEIKILMDAVNIDSQEGREYFINTVIDNNQSLTALARSDPKRYKKATRKIYKGLL